MLQGMPAHRNPETGTRKDIYWGHDTGAQFCVYEIEDLNGDYPALVSIKPKHNNSKQTARVTIHPNPGEALEEFPFDQGWNMVAEACFPNRNHDKQAFLKRCAVPVQGAGGTK